MTARSVGSTPRPETPSAYCAYPPPKAGPPIYNTSLFVFKLYPAAQLPYEETSTSSTTVLDNLAADEDVAAMRDTYEADLVQLVANLGFSCGRG